MTQDEIALLPPGQLDAFGVTAGLDDMLAPSPEAVAEIEDFIAGVRAATIMDQAGSMTRDEFAGVMRKMLEMVDVIAG